jgi:predicted ATP-binding protein involved in virulence
MNYFVKNIKVNKLLHLQDFSINIPEKSPHLIITGKNGTGKTILLKAIADFLDKIKIDSNFSFVEYRKWLEYYKTKQANTPEEEFKISKSIDYYQRNIEELYGKVEIDLIDVVELIKQYQNNNFIISFYGAGRLANMIESKNPIKPNLQIQKESSSSLTNQFLNFLSDLKIQEALARNEQQFEDADKIKQWFESFENILQEIYEDKGLKLEFNYRDYSFFIVTEGKRFKFKEMSDGFISAIDIIADLILKMQTENSLTHAYEKRGIVLVDEIETHLHLELQKIIMPLLTRVFPNIQFIVTTHSPFVLNSMNNAVAYDLEHREVIDDLTEYSYEALAEGYFKVKTGSSYMEMRLNNLETLLAKDDLTKGESEQILSLIADFEKISEAASPAIKGGFLNLMVKYSEKIKTLKK